MSSGTARDGEFAGWYVNLQEPLRRSPLGFETDDLVLDIRIQPDGSWAWKDEDELEEAVRLGRFTEDEAQAIRAEGERVVEERPLADGLGGLAAGSQLAAPRASGGLGCGLRATSSSGAASPSATSASRCHT